MTGFLAVLGAVLLVLGAFVFTQSRSSDTAVARGLLLVGGVLVVVGLLGSR